MKTKMKILPGSPLGKTAAALSFVCVLIILLQFFPGPFFQVGASTIALFGLSGFVTGLIAFIKKDRTLGTLIPILVGLLLIAVIIKIIITPDM
jgi:hypothetical protein